MNETDQGTQPRAHSSRRERAKDRFAHGAGGDLWSRLQAVDFMNQAFVLAALLMLCAVPLLMIVAALKGADYVDNVSSHMGLNDEASKDVQSLFASDSGTLASVSVISAIFLALFTISLVSIIQGFYVQIFGVDPKEAKGVWRWPVWVVLAVAAPSAIVAVNSWLKDVSGGPVLEYVFDACVLLLFWWWTMRFLLAGRRTWRYLLPAAIATAVFWIGLKIVSAIFFSSAIVANQKEYGPIGVVFILLSWLVAVGVVILLGAAVGVVWRERGMSLRRPRVS